MKCSLFCLIVHVALLMLLYIHKFFFYIWVKCIFGIYKYIKFYFSPPKFPVKFLVSQKFFIATFNLYILVISCLIFIFFNEFFHKCVESYDKLSRKN